MNWKELVGPILSKYSDTSGRWSLDEVKTDFEELSRHAPSSYIARGLSYTFRSQDTAPFAEILARLYDESPDDLRSDLLNVVFAEVPFLRPRSIQTITPEVVNEYTRELIRELMSEAARSEPAVVVRASDVYARFPKIITTLKRSEIGAVLTGTAALPDASRQLVGENTATATAKYVNFSFLDITNPYKPSKLELSEGFLENHSYRMVVSLELMPDGRFVGEQSELERPESSSNPVELDVVVLTNARSIKFSDDQISVLKWPELGPSRASENAVFVIEALEQTTKEKPAAIDIFIYHDLSLLFTARLDIEVASDKSEWTREPLPIRWHQQEDLDTNRTTLFQTFSSLNSFSKRNLNLAIQRDDVDHYIITAFIGRFEAPVRVQISRGELESNLSIIRELLDELRLERVYVTQGFDKRNSYLGDYSGETFDDQGRKLSGEEAAKVFNGFMKKVARAGSTFCHALFKSKPAKRLREIIRKTLRPGDLIQIWIDDQARDFLYPWHWLYDEPVDKPNFEPKSEMFWGHKYIIEVMPHFKELYKYDPPNAEIPSGDELVIKIGVYNFVETENQKNFFRKWSEIGKDVLKLEVWEEADQWKRYLPNCDCQIIYFFSHGHTAIPIDPTGVRLHRLTEKWKAVLDQQIKLEQNESLGRHYQQLHESLNETSALTTQTHIKLKNGILDLLALSDLEPKDPVPLVFLNMCESAQVFPSLTDGLVDVFLRHRARGVIGTEMPMIPSFADLFARRFFEEFFSRPRVDASVGKILFDLRREFMSKKNPLGFAYTFFGDATAHLSSPIRSEPAQI